MVEKKSMPEVKKPAGPIKENKELEEEINKSSAEKPDLEESLEEDNEEEKPEEELSKAEMNALIEEFTTKQNQRFLQFLRDRTNSTNSELTNSMLLKTLESQVEDSPKPSRNEDDDKDKLDYMKYENPENSKYQGYSPQQVQRLDDPEFQNKSSAEKVLEEQKRLTKSVFGGGYGTQEKEEGDKYIRLEDIDSNKDPKYKAT